MQINKPERRNMSNPTIKELNVQCREILSRVIDRGPLRCILLFCECEDRTIGVEISAMPIGQLMYFRECLDVEIRKQFDTQSTKV